jgi:bleomycin hydrolase
MLVVACSREPLQFTTEVMLPFTPVKSQGESQLCWAYAMLSAIETEHICRGDSVHLSVAFLERVMEQEADAPATKRGMGITAVNLMRRYGMVPYDAMPTTDLPLPRRAFMMGCEYTLQEFARSVCAPGEYTGIGTSDDHPYDAWFEPALKDNWEHNRLLNLPPDTLLAVSEKAVRQRHGVCWEGDISEWGFDRDEAVADVAWWNGDTTDDHCMAIVGIAHDQHDRRYFIMKNSWGDDWGPFGGLMYMSFDYFRQKTVAVYLADTKQERN